jgi:lipoate---protein ligase
MTTRPARSRPHDGSDSVVALPAVSAEDVSPYGPDDDLLASTLDDGVPRFRVSRPSGTLVVLGRGSRADVELDLDAIAADGVPVVRRSGGGCAVVLDPGNVVVSASVVQPGLPHIHELFVWFSDWLLDALDDLGLPPVRRADVSDLALGDRKVGGACLVRRRGVAFYSASLLVEPRTDRMTRYLAHPPREPAYRRGRSHEEFVGRLADLPGGWTAERLAAALGDTLRPPIFGGNGGGR